VTPSTAYRPKFAAGITAIILSLAAVLAASCSGTTSGAPPGSGPRAEPSQSHPTPAYQADFSTWPAGSSAQYTVQGNADAYRISLASGPASWIGADAKAGDYRDVSIETDVVLKTASGSSVEFSVACHYVRGHGYAFTVRPDGSWNMFRLKGSKAPRQMVQGGQLANAPSTWHDPPQANHLRADCQSQGGDTTRLRFFVNHTFLAEVIDTDLPDPGTVAVLAVLPGPGTGEADVSNFKLFNP
jgi:hypothetical protein